MGVNWTVLVLVGVMLSCGNSENWFGSGNWTVDNITTLRGKIGGLTSSDLTTYAAFAKKLSDDLNGIWAPAWNVVVLTYMYGANLDTVLCGYGFNGHWFWLNGIQIKTAYISFVIWKDFNCINWFTIDSSSGSYKGTSYSSGDFNQVSRVVKLGNSGRDVADIWNVAYDVQGKMSTVGPPLLAQRTGYSVVASQDVNAFLYAQVCAKDYARISAIDKNSNGAVLILQMRPLVSGP